MLLHDSGCCTQLHDCSPKLILCCITWCNGWPLLPEPPQEYVCNTCSHVSVKCLSLHLQQDTTQVKWSLESVPTCVSAAPQTVMMARDEVGMLRWMRCVVELTQVACHMCPNSMAVAYHKILQKLLRYMNGDYSGRLALPTEYADGRRCDAWQSFVVVACVCPPSLRERVERAAARRVSATSHFQGNHNWLPIASW